LEEQDLIRNLKRDELEEIIEPAVKKFAALLVEALEKSGLNADDIDSIELIGDGTRTPIIQENIKQIFGKQELSRTLNALECIARGASLQAAILSPTYNVASFIVEDYNSLPLAITYQFTDKEESEKKTKTMEIFALGSSFPVTKSLSFKNKLGNMDLLLHYAEGA